LLGPTCVLPIPKLARREATLSAYACILSLKNMHMLITAVKARKGEEKVREMAGRKDHVAGPGKGSGCSCTALRKASRRISQLYDTAFAPSGLKTTQHAILAQIGRSEPTMVGELAEALVMDSGAFAHTLKPLERDGLIAVAVDPLMSRSETGARNTNRIHRRRCGYGDDWVQRKSLSDKCPVARSLDIIGDWWALLIVRDALAGVTRFNDFGRSLGAVKNSLSTRLKTLVDQGIFEIRPASDGSAYQEYALTLKGRALAPVLIGLAQWAPHTPSNPGTPSLRFTRRTSAHSKKNRAEIIRRKGVANQRYSVAFGPGLIDAAINRATIYLPA
jgi:DNA-binding HxlR family transcriptional regulator